MSKKSSKLDLLVRVRFENPIPEPPFPPKLLNVSTDIQRLGEPSYLNQLAASAPLPMLADAEMGMPIDLNEFDGVWDGNDAALNPTMDSSRVTNVDDLDLLTPLRIVNANGAGTPGTMTPKSMDVSWMRNSSYIQRRDGAARRRQATEAQRSEVVDASEAAQLAAIEQSFQEVHKDPVEEMRHPDKKRKHLRVVESYDVLPDDDAWSNSYIMIKFPERPSAATALNPGATASAERLGRAVLRPIMEDDQQIMEYFLPKEDDLERCTETYNEPMNTDAANRLRENNEEDAEELDTIFPNVHYDRIRTYEVVMQAAPARELLVTFCEDPTKAPADEEEDMFGDEDPAEPPAKKRKGVYFKEISMRTQLRKTRVTKDRMDPGNSASWDKVRVGYRVPDEEEEAVRAEASKPVSDPTWTTEQLAIIRGGESQQAGMGDAVRDDDDEDDD